MKSINIFLILLCLVELSCSKVYKINNLFGKWSGIKDNKEIIINFKDDKTFNIIIKDKIEIIEENFSGVYIVDFSKRPIPLSFKKVQELNHSLYTIIEFIDNDIIKFGLLTKNERIRNIAFEDTKHIVLKRLNEY
jgi:hypothetical protein